MARDLRLALRIQTDLGETPKRLNTLKGQLGGVAKGAESLGRKSGPAATGLRSLGTASRDAGPSFSRAGNNLKKMDFAVAGLAANLATIWAQTVLRGVTGFASGVVESGLKFQALEQRLKFAVGPERAAREFAFLQGEAERLGINLLTAGDGFSTLTAARAAAVSASWTTPHIVGRYGRTWATGHQGDPGPVGPASPKGDKGSRPRGDFYLRLPIIGTYNGIEFRYKTTDGSSPGDPPKNLSGWLSSKLPESWEQAKGRWFLTRRVGGSSYSPNEYPGFDYYAAMAALPNSGAAVISDTVTLYDPARNWIETRAWDGRGWRSIDKRLDGHLLMPGSVTANAINVQTLSALSATLGTFRSADAGERVEISDNRISVYDAAGRLRVRIGDLS